MGGPHRRVPHQRADAHEAEQLVDAHGSGWHLHARVHRAYTGGHVRSREEGHEESQQRDSDGRSDYDAECTIAGPSFFVHRCYRFSSRK